MSSQCEPCPACGRSVPDDSIWYAPRLNKFCCSEQCGKAALTLGY